jgi:SAM-dependent methyltransferase
MYTNVVEAAKSIGGLMYSDELNQLARLAMGAREIVELGCWKGRSLTTMALANPEATLTGVDSFQDMAALNYEGSSEAIVRENLDRFGVGGRVTILQGKTYDAIANYAGKCDLLHIDAGHEEKDVVGDIRDWLPCVRPGGAVVFHDYGDWMKNKSLIRPGVNRTVDAWRNSDWIEVELQSRAVAFRNCLAERGVLYIAYGENARTCAKKSMETCHALVPDLPVALIADAPIGGEDFFLWHLDCHPGARVQKTGMYWLSPFRETLFMDADTLLQKSPMHAFELLELTDLVLGLDVWYTVEQINWPALVPEEVTVTRGELPTSSLLYYNSGVIAFRRSPAAQKLFTAWHQEWLRWAQHDQLALARAMYKNPVRIATMRESWQTRKDHNGVVFHDHRAASREDAPK